MLCIRLRCRGQSRGNGLCLFDRATMLFWRAHRDERRYGEVYCVLERKYCGIHWPCKPEASRLLRGKLPAPRLFYAITFIFSIAITYSLTCFTAVLCTMATRLGLSQNGSSWKSKPLLGWRNYGRANRGERWINLSLSLLLLLLLNSLHLFSC